MNHQNLSFPSLCEQPLPHPTPCNMPVQPHSSLQSRTRIPGGTVLWAAPEILVADRGDEVGAFRGGYCTAISFVPRPECTPNRPSPAVPSADDGLPYGVRLRLGLGTPGPGDPARRHTAPPCGLGMGLGMGLGLRLRMEIVERGGWLDSPRLLRSGHTGDLWIVQLGVGLGLKLGLGLAFQPHLGVWLRLVDNGDCAHVPADIAIGLHGGGAHSLPKPTSENVTSILCLCRHQPCPAPPPA